MKRISYNGLAFAMIAICTMFAFSAGVAQATPVINAAKDSVRVFNNCAVTNLITTNAYPALISFDESFMVCTGGANMHIWNLSSDGGASSAIFNNKDAFTISATLVLDRSSGSTVGSEGGLRISPWWDSVANGYFNARLPDGEIAVFGGVLPFFSFTGAFGIHYAQGQRLRQTMIYVPHCNTANDPATIEYQVNWQGQNYTSGPLPFTNCTSGEEAHGCYGIMDNARVGGRNQNSFDGSSGNPNAENVGSFFDILYTINAPQDCPVPTQNKTWGGLKATYR